MDSLMAARDQALEASRIKTAFLNLVSHELRTPLTALRLQIDQLRREPGTFTDRQARMLNKVDRSTQRLDTLVGSLLDYTRIQAGRLSVNSEPTDVARVVREVVEETSPQAEQKGLLIRTELPEPARTLETDPRLLRLILVNLVTNAVKFTERGHITLSMNFVGESVRLRVSDTGPGIPGAEQGRIFEPFEQLEHVDRKHTPGVGLGLAIVRELARTLGGEVTVESEPGKGSIFWVMLPPFPAKRPTTPQDGSSPSDRP
jgi:signal transduction histidine kinase